MDVEKLNQKLKEIFSNGKGEAGLELGIDAGLAPSEYIRIPECMKKIWCARVNQEEYSAITGEPILTNVRKYKKDHMPAEFVNSPGWVSAGAFRICNKRPEVQIKRKVDDMELKYWCKLEEFHIEPPTVDDMRAFFTVNKNHIRDLEIDEQDHIWVHAVRFWSVVAGFVITSKSKEYVFVKDPETIDSKADEFVEKTIPYGIQAWTACAARATSWRKTNHATGGEIVQGYPRRWMNKENKLSDIPDKASKLKHDKLKTSAFYVATHAASVHAVLAFMAPTDEAHWANFIPDYGAILEWDVGMSTSIRMAPKDQVAGTAVVVDSVVVLKMLVSEGLAPMLNNVAQVDSLVSAYEEVQQGGITCSVYAKWFLDGHPAKIKPSTFSQRDPRFFELATELAIVSQRYYSSSTIALSAALQNVAKQSIDESLKTNWSSIALSRKETSTNDFISAVQKIKGGLTTASISNLISNDPVIASNALEEYNSSLSHIAARLQVRATMIQV